MIAVAWAIVLYTVVSHETVPKNSRAMAVISAIVITVFTMKELAR